MVSSLKRKHKYGNRKITVGGITFDSKKEARRYQELYFQQRAGEISDLELQRRFELIPAQYETYARYGKKGQRLKDGQRCIEKAVFYVADFTYQKDGQTVTAKNGFVKLTTAWRDILAEGASVTSISNGHNYMSALVVKGVPADTEITFEVKSYVYNGDVKTLVDTDTFTRNVASAAN